MSETKVLSTYERIILFKRMPYWLYWIFFGVIGFISGEIALYLLNEKHFLVTQALFAAGIGLLPIVIISFSHQFESVTAGLSEILWDNEIEYKNGFIHDKHEFSHLIQRYQS